MDDNKCVAGRAAGPPKNPQVGMLLLVLGLFIIIGSMLFHRNSAPKLAAQMTAAPSPNPVQSVCELLAQLYPPTQEAFEEHGLSKSNQAEVRKWVARIPRKEQSYAKWTLAPSSEYENLLLVFNTKPDGGEGWVAVNTNIDLDLTNCEEVPLPGA